MNKVNECTCPSGDGSLVHPCPAHPAVEQAGWDERAAFEAAFAAMGRPVCRADYDQDAYGTPFDDGGWTGWQARAALAQPSPVRSSLLINGYQLRAALDFIAPDGTAEQLESEACIEWRQQDADFLEAGLYAFCAEYPEEGGVLLDEEPTTAQPSPLQSEQAEAERPEVVAYFDRNYPSTGDAFIWSNYEGSPYEPMMTVSQHERIVGELRAKADQLREALEWRKENQAGQRERLRSVTAERDAALARVAELEQQEPLKLSDDVREFLQEGINSVMGGEDADMDYEFASQLGKLLDPVYAAPVAQAQHSVPEGWKPVPIEPLLNMMSDKDHDTRITAERQLLSILAAAPGKEVPQAWIDVQAERRRQVEAEGWTPEHDDKHETGALASAAGCYAMFSLAYPAGDPSHFWPWDKSWWKPSPDGRRNMVKAGALILAEIERLDRAAASQGGPSDA
ncbi:hypothetical protein LJG53_14835 [Pseudomonas aeruginosa]|uniref:hypothetical protein n=1 Tax=Pseudomonas aeruginosa TaxID=287 RepID=UPI001D0BCA3C|nr:hypothetical protein [Pseudomonas aeruginosa]MCC0559671.1 hypothetical protein [Pseudomonas aeruginosa]